MKYQIIREGKTVCIGHCKTITPITERSLEYTVDEIRRRKTPKKFADDGITFEDQDYIGPRMGDIVEITAEYDFAVIQLMFGKQFKILEISGRPASLTE